MASFTLQAAEANLAVAMKKRVVASPIVDSETRAHAEHHQSIRLWLRLLACTNLIKSLVRTRLRTGFKITLPRFDVMAQLVRAPQGMKMSALSKRLMVTNGNVTGIIDRLAMEGLVVREDDPKDRRIFIVKLTPEGRKVFNKMAKGHEPWIIELYSSLSEKQRQQLYALLGAIKTHAATIGEGKLA